LPDIGVLLVEDERLLDRVVSDALRTLGLSCEVARSEAEAIRFLQQRHYNLMILDLRLQGGSGVNVLEQARRLHGDMPVILVTAYTITEEVQTALAWGVDALLYKPFDIDTLLATVRALLNRRALPLPTHAVVLMGMSSNDPAVRQMGVLKIGDLATLKSAALSLVCHVRQMDEHWLSVETERIEPPAPTRWQFEWTGADALYQFPTRVIQYLPQENSTLWILRQPSIIRRVQRRRYPRVKVSGRAFVSLTGRLQRAIEATLLDMSEQGVCVVLSEPPHRGAVAHLEVHADTEVGAIEFQREGIVRSVVAFVEQGQPRYRVGLQLERLPNDAVKRLRQIRIARLTATAKPEDSSLRSE
jgi:DNA-binding response OmpR family regulator/c-di-GMP-binding flagellar brake protein YcgR